MDDAAIATLKKNEHISCDALPWRIHGKEYGRSDVPEFSKQKMRDVIAAMRKNTSKAFQPE